MKFRLFSFPSLLLSAWCAVFPAPAIAQQLIFIGTGATGTLIYLNPDVETDRQNRNIKYYWSSLDDEWTYAAVNCQFRFRIYPIAIYKPGQEPTFFTKGESYTVNRGTVGDDLTREVCRR